jgi:hypothetical protein
MQASEKKTHPARWISEIGPQTLGIGHLPVQQDKRAAPFSEKDCARRPELGLVNQSSDFEIFLLVGRGDLICAYGELSVSKPKILAPYMTWVYINRRKRLREVPVSEHTTISSPSTVCHT